MGGKKRTPGAPQSDNGSVRTGRPQGQQRPSRAPDTARHHRSSEHFNGTLQQRNGDTDRRGNDFMQQRRQANARAGQEATRQNRLSHQSVERIRGGGPSHSRPVQNPEGLSEADPAMQMQDWQPSTGQLIESGYWGDNEGDTLIGSVDEQVRQNERGEENAADKGKRKQPEKKATQGKKKSKKNKRRKTKKRRNVKKKNKNKNGDHDDSEDGDTNNEKDDNGSDVGGGCQGPGDSSGSGKRDDGGDGSGGTAARPTASGRLPNHQRPGGPKPKKPNPRKRRQKANVTPQAPPPSGSPPNQQYPTLILLQSFPQIHEHGLVCNCCQRYQLWTSGMWPIQLSAQGCTFHG